MRPTAIATCLLLAVCSVRAQQVSPKQQVYTLLRQNRFAEAEAAARTLIQASPSDCSLRAMLGLAQRGERNGEAAFLTFQEAARMCAQSLPVLEGAAETAYALHKPETASLLRQLLLLRPDDPTTHAMLGSVEAREGDCKAAVEDDRAGLSQVTNNPPALRQYAGCLVAVDDKADAVDTLKQLVALEDNAANRMALASAQNQAGDRSDALATLQPLLTSGPEQADALLLAAQIADADNKTPQAVAWLRQAITMAPAKYENYVYFAQLSLDHGSYQVGVDMVDLGLRQLPDNARLLVSRGVLEVQLGKLDQALADFERAHQVDPKLSFTDDAMGVLLSQKHDSAAALALFQQKSEANPKDALLQYLYAEVLAESASGDPAAVAKAAAAARRALVIEPSYTPARDLLCVLLLRSGDLPGVVKEAEEATRRDPYDESALYQELLAQRKLGKPEITRQLVERLQQAKQHNQAAATKYVLREQGEAQP